MTYRSFTDNLPSPIQRLMEDPASWAVVGSVGLHGIILALLPFMSLPSPENTEPDIENRVPVVELDAEQLSRVPDFSESEVPFPNDFSSSEIERYTLEDFLELPSTNVPEVAPRPEPIPPRTRAQRQPFTWPSWPTPSTSTRTRTQIRTPDRTSSSQRQEDSRSTSSDTDNPETQDNDQDNADSTDTAEADEDQNEQDSTNTSETDTEENNEDDSQSVATGDTGESSDSEEPPTPQERLLAEQQQLQQQFTYRPPSEGEVNEAISLWNNVAKDANIQEGGPVNIDVDQSLLTCPLGENVTVLSGVFVGSDNTVLAEPGPQILLSSGYEFFDNAAKEFVAAHDFDNQSGDNRNYAVTINFLYDEEACPAAPVSQEEVGSSDGGDNIGSQQESSQDEANPSSAESSEGADNNS